MALVSTPTAAPSSGRLALPPNSGYFLLNPAVPATPAPAAPTTTTPPPASPTPATTGIDYDALLKNDPSLSQTLAGLNAQGAAAKAGLTAEEQRALIGYGGTPSSSVLGGVPGLADIVDQTTRDLASQNTGAGLSTLAKLSQAYQQSQQASDASLAARGILRSGAYGQHAAENLQTYNQNQDTATRQLLDYLNGLYSGYQSQLGSLQGQGSSATNDALNRIVAQIQAGLLGGGNGATTGSSSSGDLAAVPPVAPPPDSLRIARPGHPVYA